MTMQDSSRDVISHLIDLALTCLDRVKSFAAKSEPRGVLFVKPSDSRVQVPAVVIEFVCRVVRQRLDLKERHLFDVFEPDDNVSYLHSGVVDVVLNFDL